MVEKRMRNVFEINVNKRITRAVSEYEYRTERDQLILEELKKFPAPARQLVEQLALELSDKLTAVAIDIKNKRPPSEPAHHKPFVPGIESLKVLIILIALRDDLIRLE